MDSRRQLTAAMRTETHVHKVRDLKRIIHAMQSVMNVNNWV